MRRTTLIATALAVALIACDSTVEPGDMTLDDVPGAPANTAVIVVTEDLLGIQDVIMEAGYLYFFELRTPPPLPELVYDVAIHGTAPTLRLVLESATQVGTSTTGTGGASFLFVAPDGAAFEPRTTCRLNVTSALDESGAGRLQGNVDCPVTDGQNQMRILARFDYSPG